MRRRIINSGLDDSFIRIEEEWREDAEGNLFLDRKVMLKAAVEKIVLNLSLDAEKVRG